VNDATLRNLSVDELYRLTATDQDAVGREIVRRWLIDSLDIKEDTPRE
jgi:hypothetical protein